MLADLPPQKPTLPSIRASQAFLNEPRLCSDLKQCKTSTGNNCRSSTASRSRHLSITPTHDDAAQSKRRCFMASRLTVCSSLRACSAQPDSVAPLLSVTLLPVAESCAIPAVARQHTSVLRAHAPLLTSSDPHQGVASPAPGQRTPVCMALSSTDTPRVRPAQCCTQNLQFSEWVERNISS